MTYFYNVLWHFRFFRSIVTFQKHFNTWLLEGYKSLLSFIISNRNAVFGIGVLLIATTVILLFYPRKTKEEELASVAVKQVIAIPINYLPTFIVIITIINTGHHHHHHQSSSSIITIIIINHHHHHYQNYQYHYHYHHHHHHHHLHNHHQ